MGEELIPEEGFLDTKAFLECFYNQSEPLRAIALNGRLGRLRNRFISWRIFLGIFDENSDPTEWAATALAQRQLYDQIHDKYSVIPSQNLQVHDLDPLIFNPLSPASENPWNNFYQDNELKQIIRNDVDRTLQERALFQKEETKEMMVRILFIWTREHAEIGYRQGMNELLAVLLIVAIAEKAGEMSELPEDKREVLRVLNAGDKTEADVFWMFSRLMELGVKEMFLPVVAKTGKKGKNISFDREHNELVNSDKTHETNASLILKRCHRIHHRLLQALDKPLYTYIESQKIEPQIYLQRWVRCLLTREFALSDSLTLWDSIFACINVQWDNKIEAYTGKLDFSRELVMLDFLCVAMIVFVRGFCKA
jgi:TBC1 domain family member 5